MKSSFGFYHFEEIHVAGWLVGCCPEDDEESTDNLNNHSSGFYTEKRPKKLIWIVGYLIMVFYLFLLDSFETSRFPFEQ